MVEQRRAAPPTQAPNGGPYPVGMTGSAHDVAAGLRQRAPGLQIKKLHKLLYYCQGHHLATYGEPLFRESISAWDMGPVVGELWHREKQGHGPATPPELTEAQLNTLGYVLSRYGGLTGLDLEHLTHSEAPWRLANKDRQPGDSARIELEWIGTYFMTSRAAEEGDEGLLDQSAVTEWLRHANDRRTEPLQPDTSEDIKMRLTASSE